MDGAWPVVLPVAAVAATVFCTVLAVKRLALALAIQNTPTSRIRSAAQGLIELEGRPGAMPGPPIISPLSGRRCLWWDCQVRYKKGKNERLIWRKTSDDLFALADTSGHCIVDPVGATVIPNLQRTWRGASEQPGRIPRPGWDALITFGPYTYRERMLLPGGLLYARGWFRTQRAVVEANERRDVTALLAEWKRDRADLLRRFDSNQDGNVDLDEWEAARRAALAEVHARYLDQAEQPDINVLSAPIHQGGDYILSGIPQDQLIRRYRWQAALLALAAIVAGGAALVLLEPLA